MKNTAYLYQSHAQANERHKTSPIQGRTKRRASVVMFLISRSFTRTSPKELYLTNKELLPGQSVKNMADFVHVAGLLLSVATSQLTFKFLQVKTLLFPIFDSQASILIPRRIISINWPGEISFNSYDSGVQVSVSMLFISTLCHFFLVWLF